jgi:hypothetical protein
VALEEGMGWQPHRVVLVKTPFIVCPKPLGSGTVIRLRLLLRSGGAGDTDEKVKPAFPRPDGLVAAKAGFQIAHSAPLRFAFGMTKIKIMVQTQPEPR